MFDIGSQEAVFDSPVEQEYEEALMKRNQLIDCIMSYSNQDNEQYTEEDILKRFYVDSTSRGALFLKGVILEELGRQSEAEIYYKQLDTNELCKCWRRLGDVFSVDYKEYALKCYDKVLSINPRDLATLYVKGLLYESIGNLEEAKACYKKMPIKNLLVEDILFPVGFWLLGASLIAITANIGDESWLSWIFGIPGAIITSFALEETIRGRWRGKWKLWRLSKRFGFRLNNTSELCNYWRRIGYVLSRHHKEYALKCYDRVLSINPRDLATLYVRGFLYESIGNLEEAKACYKKMPIKNLLVEDLLFPVVLLFLWLFFIAIAAVNIDEESWLLWVFGIPAIILTFVTWGEIVRGMGRLSKKFSSYS